jgi:thiol-disulfide isomerase/thioredoxin
VASRRIPLVWVLASTAVALAVAGLVVLVANGSSDDDDAQAGDLTLIPQDELPATAADVTLGGLGDQPTAQLGDYLGTKPVVVNFFSSTCAPCVEEMPAFERVHQDVGDQVSFVGLAEVDLPDNALDLVRRTGVTYPTYSDGDGSALAYFEGLQLPTTVFLDKDGKVLATSNTKLSEEKLRDLLDEHFGIAA